MDCKQCGTNKVMAKGLCRKCYDKQRDRSGKYAESKRRYRARSRRFVQRVKRASRCCDCGESDPVCLDFHHEGGKDFSIGDAQRLGFGVERIKDEIRKCVIVCANCHRKRHAGFKSHQPRSCRARLTNRAEGVRSSYNDYSSTAHLPSLLRRLV